MDSIHSADKARARRAALVMGILGLLILVVFIISMNSGEIKLGPLQVIKTLFGFGDARQSLVLFEFRLPRIVIAILIGACFAVSGCIMQGITRNALADPGILGINAGAGLAVVLYVSFFPVKTAASPFLMPFLAFIGAALTALLIYLLAYKRHQGLSPTRMLLVGIGVAAGISAAMIVLTILLDPNQFQFVQVWLAGTIWGTTWKFVLALLPWFIVLIPFAFSKAKVMNILTLGEQTATGLGAPVERQRLLLLAAAVGLAASSVAVGGGIGFVGLVAPHLARRLVGPQYQYALPASALVGGLLVIVADTIGRTISSPSEIATGIVVAVIGAPYFLYLLARAR
ncbi:FecCD family ABC transporter permease [Paenibacillus sp. GCM10012307]|uniref:Iron ABC transporter permease n=1 Tax=Paenibacillus roseus TaxID=2798579 RepID=A0A934J3N0_9BACL|nr:iron ABC transporter permease [Paenibacillus roseus]MBJ6362220.1 iron ABC transporter permease [Paenibacillus roseus]